MNTFVRSIYLVSRKESQLLKAGKAFVFLLVVMIFTASVTFADALKIGSKGDEVKELQSQLKKEGYFSGQITGYFGSMTEVAVKVFQAKNKMTVDGIVGAGTKKAVFGTAVTSSGKAELLDWSPKRQKSLRLA
jgi:murein L,D-transpeptidase YcbB/YkuD